MSGAGPDPEDDDDGADYNPIFRELYDAADSQTRGLVAYGFYKIAKREWAQAIYEEHGRTPTPEELTAYIATWTPSQLDNARTKADQTLAAFAENVIAEEEPRILRRAVRGKFWKSVGASMTAAALYTLILIVLAIVLARSGIDLIGILRSTPPVTTG